MKKLNKRHSINNSIEAYAYNPCTTCQRSCSCSCNPIREYNSNYTAVSDSRYRSNSSAVWYYNGY